MNLQRVKNFLKVIIVLTFIGSMSLHIFYTIPKQNAERAKKIEARTIKMDADWAAKETCGAWIKSVANHPSTVDLHLITGSNVTVAPNGNRIVFLIFDAKNSFGLELRQKALCLISPQGEFIEASIAE